MTRLPMKWPIATTMKMRTKGKNSTPVPSTAAPASAMKSPWNAARWNAADPVPRSILCANAGRHLAQIGLSLSAKYLSRIVARHSEHAMYAADTGAGAGLGSGAFPLPPPDSGGDVGLGGSFGRTKLLKSWSPRSALLGSFDMRGGPGWGVLGLHSDGRERSGATSTSIDP